MAAIASLAFVGSGLTAVGLVVQPAAPAAASSATFNLTGCGSGSWFSSGTAPAGATTATFQIWGGGGSAGDVTGRGGSGGGGALVSGTVPVTPNSSVLYAKIGCGGTNGGVGGRGYSNGGTAASPTGGGGGGSTAICLGSTSSDCTTTGTMLALAAGGGGGGGGTTAWGANNGGSGGNAIGGAAASGENGGSGYGGARGENGTGTFKGTGGGGGGGIGQAAPSVSGAAGADVGGAGGTSTSCSNSAGGKGVDQPSGSVILPLTAATSGTAGTGGAGGHSGTCGSIDGGGGGAGLAGGGGGGVGEDYCSGAVVFGACIGISYYDGAGGGAAGSSWVNGTAPNAVTSPGFSANNNHTTGAADCSTTPSSSNPGYGAGNGGNGMGGCPGYVTVTWNVLTTSTSVVCSPSTVLRGNVTTCTTTVTDTSPSAASPFVPAGTVTLASNSLKTDFFGVATDTTHSQCTLGSPSGLSSSCSVRIINRAAETITITASYASSDAHISTPNSGSTNVVVSPSSSPTVFNGTSLVAPGSTVTVHTGDSENVYGYNFQASGFWGAEFYPSITYGGGEVEGTIPGSTATDADGHWELHTSPGDGTTTGKGTVKLYTSTALAITIPLLSDSPSLVPWVSSDYTLQVNCDATCLSAAAKVGGIRRTSDTGTSDVLVLDPNSEPAVDHIGLEGSVASQLKARVDAGWKQYAPVSRAYYAFWGVAPNYEQLTKWAPQLAAGATEDAMATELQAGPRYASYYGKLGDVAFVNAAYQRTLSRSPNPDELTAATAALANGTTRAQLLLGLAESGENITNTFNRDYIVGALPVLSFRSATADEISRYKSELDFGTVRVQVIEDVALMLHPVTWNW